MPPFCKGLTATILLLLTGPLLASVAKATNTTLAIAPGNTVVTGAVVTLTANIASTSVSTGSVVFCNASAAHCEDAAILGTATAVKVSSTQLSATIQLRLGVGTHSINAVFLPTLSNLGSMSVAQTITVTSSPIYSSTTTLASNGSAGNYALSGTVTGFGSQPLGGSLRFLDTSTGDLQIGAASLDLPTWTFSSPVFLSSDTYPTAHAVGDFNRDGRLDLVTVSGTSTGSMSVLLGNGDGTFRARVDYPADANLTYIAVGDFNGDGRLDLVTVSGTSAGLMSVWLGNGDGTFQPKADYSVDANPSSVAVGDFNGDGKPDLGILSSPSSTGLISVLLGNGDGTFQPKIDNLANATPVSIAIGDFNSDGKPDLAVAYNIDTNVSVLLGNGDGTFQPKVDYPTSTASNSVRIGDFNGDGKLDLVTNDTSTAVAVLLGNGDGTFQPKVDYPTSWPAEFFVVGDFNGDGRSDIAFTNGGVGTISLMFGNGDGSFQPDVNLLGSVNHYPIAIGDFNGDGVQDITGGGYNEFVLFGKQTANYSANAISVFGTGTHNVLAAYSDDAGRVASQSATVSLTGLPGTTTIYLSTSQNPARYGSDLTISAAFTAVGGVNPTGSVTFKDGGTTLGSSIISGGVASFTSSSLAIGTHSLTAVYSGDANYNSATSIAVSQTINQLSLGSYAPSQPALVFIPGQITTIVGTGAGGGSGDGGLGTSAQINQPYGAVLDFAGNLYISDGGNNKIRKLNTSTGIMTTFAGTGTVGYSGDGGPATNARINSPRALSADQSGNVYFADRNNQCVRRIDAATNVMTTVAGTCTSAGYSGDGGPATIARLNQPTDVVIDSAGNMFIADSGNSCVRKVAVGSGTISTIAGICASPGFSGDGGQATSAQMNSDEYVALDRSGNLYIADTANNRVRKVDGTTLDISTIAGTGAASYNGDGDLATAAALNLPAGLAFDGAGNLYIADRGNDVIRMVNAATSGITTIAGTGGVSGYAGDGGPATTAKLNAANGVMVSPSGVLYIVDQGNNVIRMVGPSGVLAFGSQATGTQSASMIQTIANYGSTALTFSAEPVVTGDFSIQSGNTCGVSPLAPSATCNLTIEFVPTAVGARAGTVQFSNNGIPNSQTLYLSGTATMGASSVLLSGTPDPSTYGDSVTFKASVPSGATGTVTFKDGNETLGLASISGGAASIATTSLSAGTHIITGVYGGDSNYAGSRSANLYQTVNKASANLNLTSSTNPSPYGAALTLKATIVPAATGTVTFADGSNQLGSVTLNSGSASLTISNLTAGSHSIVAIYSGDPNYQ